MAAMTERVLYERALARLARREHTRATLARSLGRLDPPRDILEAVLTRLSAEGWLDDERYARERLRSLLARGHGPLRVAGELRAAGLSRAQVDHALAEQRLAFLASARDLCRRRLGEGWDHDPVRVEHARRLLARRGYEAATLRRLFRGEDDEAFFE